MNGIETLERATRTQRGLGAYPSHQAPRAGEYLAFRIAAEEYGIDLLRIQEIRQFDTPTRMAGQPTFVLGVINLRGVIVPVVDLRVLFGVEPRFDAMTVSVVLNVGRRTLAMVVDAVVDVIALSADQIKPTPEFNRGVEAHCIAGLAALTQGETERLLILVDAERLMTAADMGAASTDLH